MCSLVPRLPQLFVAYSMQAKKVGKPGNEASTLLLHCQSTMEPIHVIQQSTSAIVQADTPTEGPVNGCTYLITVSVLLKKRCLSGRPDTCVFIIFPKK